MGTVTAFVVFVISIECIHVLSVEASRGFDMGFWGNILNLKSSRNIYSNSHDDSETGDLDFDTSDVFEYGNSDEDSNDSRMYMREKYANFRRRQAMMRNRFQRMYARRQKILEGIKRKQFRNRYRHKDRSQRTQNAKQLHKERKQHKGNKHDERKHVDRNRKQNKDTSDSIERVDKRIHQYKIDHGESISSKSSQKYNVKDFEKYRQSRIFRNRLQFRTRTRSPPGAESRTSTTEAESQESRESTTPMIQAETEAYTESNEVEHETTEAGTRKDFGSKSRISTTDAASQESRERTTPLNQAETQTNAESHEIEYDVTPTPETEEPITATSAVVDTVTAYKKTKTTPSTTTTTENEIENEKEIAEPSLDPWIDLINKFGNRIEFENRTHSNLTVNNTLENLVKKVKDRGISRRTDISGNNTYGSASGQSGLIEIVKAVESVNSSIADKLINEKDNLLIKSNRIYNNQIGLEKLVLDVENAKRTKALDVGRRPAENVKQNSELNNLVEAVKSGRSSHSKQVLNSNNIIPSPIVRNDKTTNLKNSNQNTNVDTHQIKPSNSSKNEANVVQPSNQTLNSRLNQIIQGVISEDISNNSTNSVLPQNRKKLFPVNSVHIPVPVAPSNDKPKNDNELQGGLSRVNAKLKHQLRLAQKEPSKPIKLGKGGKSVGITSLMQNTIVSDIDKKRKTKEIRNNRAPPSIPISNSKEKGASKSFTFDVVKPPGSFQQNILNDVNMRNQLSEENIGFEIKETPLMKTQKQQNNINLAHQLSEENIGFEIKEMPLMKAQNGIMAPKRGPVSEPNTMGGHNTIEKLPVDKEIRLPSRKGTAYNTKRQNMSIKTPETKSNHVTDKNKIQENSKTHKVSNVVEIKKGGKSLQIVGSQEEWSKPTERRRGNGRDIYYREKPKHTSKERIYSASSGQLQAKTFSIAKDKSKPQGNDIKTSMKGMSNSSDKKFHLSNQFDSNSIALQRKNLEADTLNREHAPIAERLVQNKENTKESMNANSVSISNNLKNSLKSKFSRTESHLNNSKGESVKNGEGSRGITQNVIKKSEIQSRLRKIHPSNLLEKGSTKINTPKPESSHRKSATSPKHNLNQPSNVQSSKPHSSIHSNTESRNSTVKVLSLKGPLSAPVQSTLKIKHQPKQIVQNSLKSTSHHNTGNAISPFDDSQNMYNEGVSSIYDRIQNAKRLAKQPSKNVKVSTKGIKHSLKGDVTSQGHSEGDQKGRHRSYAPITDSREVKGGNVNANRKHKANHKTVNTEQYIPTKLTKELSLGHVTNSHQRNLPKKKKGHSEQFTLEVNPSRRDAFELVYDPIRVSDAAVPKSFTRKGNTFISKEQEPKGVWSSAETRKGVVKKAILAVDSSVEKKEKLNLSRGRNIRLNTGRHQGNNGAPQKRGPYQQEKGHKFHTAKLKPNSQDDHTSLSQSKDQKHKNERHLQTKTRHHQRHHERSHQKMNLSQDKTIQHTKNILSKKDTYLTKGINQGERKHHQKRKHHKKTANDTPLQTLVNEVAIKSKENVIYNKDAYRNKTEGSLQKLVKEVFGNEPNTPPNFKPPDIKLEIAGETSPNKLRNKKKGHSNIRLEIIDNVTAKEISANKIMKNEKTPFNSKETIRYKSSSEIYKGRGMVLMSDKRRKKNRKRKETKPITVHVASVKHTPMSREKIIPNSKRNRRQHKTRNRNGNRAGHSTNDIMGKEASNFNGEFNANLHSGEKRSERMRSRHTGGGRMKLGMRRIGGGRNRGRRTGQSRDRLDVQFNRPLGNQAPSNIVFKSDVTSQRPEQTTDYKLVGKWTNGNFVKSLKAGNKTVHNSDSVTETVTTVVDIATELQNTRPVFNGRDNPGGRQRGHIMKNSIGTGDRNVQARNMPSANKMGVNSGERLQVDSPNATNAKNISDVKIRNMDINTNNDNKGSDNPRIKIFKPSVMSDGNGTGHELTIGEDYRTRHGSRDERYMPTRMEKSRDERYLPLDKSVSPNGGVPAMSIKNLNESDNVSVKFNVVKKPTTSNSNNTRHNVLSLPPPAYRNTNNGNGAFTLPVPVYQNSNSNSKSPNNVRSFTSEKQTSKPITSVSTNNDGKFELEIEGPYHEGNQTDSSHVSTATLTSAPQNTERPPTATSTSGENELPEYSSYDGMEYPHEDDNEVLDPWSIGHGFLSGEENDDYESMYDESDSREDTSDGGFSHSGEPNMRREMHSRYGGNGYNVFTGSWIDSARESAKEMAEELEGNWKDVNITKVGNNSDTCPNYRIRYKDNAVIIDTVKNACRVIITWNKRQKRVQKKERTWWGTRVYYKTRTVFVPVVTYVDLRP